MALLSDRIAKLERQAQQGQRTFMFSVDLSRGEAHRADAGDLTFWRHTGESNSDFRSRVHSTLIGSPGFVVFT